ncbi:MAG TPA: serine hydrolase domain-containing protein, partial [Thermoanaerobaculia bacterium]|nr:serine hydrolase domain-containing protein [Thermoanaerobaculia bacterium]
MRFVTAFTIALLLALPLPAQQLDAVDRIARDAMAAWRIPGLAIAVVKDDRVVHLGGYGVRELGGAPVTPDTLFQIASTSKAFTTAAMAILVDEKKMKWDDPVRAHLDYFRLSEPCADSLVTLRDIVSHRTGL